MSFFMAWVGLEVEAKKQISKENSFIFSARHLHQASDTLIREPSAKIQWSDSWLKIIFDSKQEAQMELFIFSYW